MLRPGWDRYQRVSPQVVAVMLSPLVSSRLRREPGAASATSTTVSASACPSSSPPRSRARTSAHTSAESLRASSDSTSTAGRLCTRGASDPGHPFTAPLWLNSQGPVANGAAAASASAPARVASRTAPSRAPVRTTRVRSAKDGSPRWARHGGTGPGSGLLGVPTHPETIGVDRPVPLPPWRPRLAVQAVRGLHENLAEQLLRSQIRQVTAHQTSPADRAVRNPEKICRRIG